MPFMDDYIKAKQIITESQNHRMLGVGRDLCGSFSPTPPPKQGHPEQDPKKGLYQVHLKTTNIGIRHQKRKVNEHENLPRLFSCV